MSNAQLTGNIQQMFGRRNMGKIENEREGVLRNQPPVALKVIVPRTFFNQISEDLNTEASRDTDKSVVGLVV